MKELLKDDFDAYMESFNDSRLYGLDQSIKNQPEEFLKISPFKLKPVPWIENGFYFSGVSLPKASLLFCWIILSTEAGAIVSCECTAGKDGQCTNLEYGSGGKSTELELIAISRYFNYERYGNEGQRRF